jgi:hypothetical protein
MLYYPDVPIPADQNEAIAKRVWQTITDVAVGPDPLDMTLFHYTDSGGLLGIVQSGRMRATHVSYMNDASEYLHAATLLLEVIKDAKGLATGRLEQALLSELQANVESTRPDNVYGYFVACFSEHENDLNQQWRRRILLRL